MLFSFRLLRMLVGIDLIGLKKSSPGVRQPKQRLSGARIRETSLTSSGGMRGMPDKKGLTAHAPSSLLVASGRDASFFF